MILAAAVTATAMAQTVYVPTGRGTVAVTALEGNSFRVSRPEAGTTEATPVNAVRPRGWNDARTWAFNGDGYTLYVDRASGAVNFVTAAGDTLLSEQEPMRFRTRKGTGFYGAGERGHSLRLTADTLLQWNKPNYGYGEGDKRISRMGITMPWLLSDAGYGLLFNDASESMITFPRTDAVAYDTENERPVSYTFVGGGSMPGVTENFTRVAGRQDLPPFWALGYITSKYGYHTEQEALGAIDSLKRAGYPVDGIIFDLYWYGKETDMGRLEWNKTQFPDHKRMLDSLNNMGVHTILIHQPYINKIGAIDNYNTLDAAGLLTHDSAGNTKDVHTWVGDAGMFDISNANTREWLWNRLKGLTAEGLAGWWGDLGEPEVHPLEIVHANGLKAKDYHNVYGNDWSKMIYEGLRKDFPEMRPFLLMRGGTTGLQQYSVFPWTGDVARSWSGLQPQVKLMLNSGLSGLGYMSSDIGGFAVDAKKPYDPELYVRWMQLGVFNPVLRTHAQGQPEPYHYPQQSKLLRELIDMRYQWLPYNYTLAYENASEGQPLARPVNYYGGKSASEKFGNVADEYLWGPEVLVAPVMNPGVKSRKVLFPDLSAQGEPATVWIDWFNTARKYKGGTEMTVPVTMREFPLFVKVGAFIPQYMRKMNNVGEYDPKYLTVKYFAGAKGEYTLFDDDRKDPESLDHHQYALTHFTADGKGEIRIETTGDYTGKSAKRELTMEIVGVARPKAVTVNGKAVKHSYTTTGRTVTFTFECPDSQVTIKY